MLSTQSCRSGLFRRPTFASLSLPLGGRRRRWVYVFNLGRIRFFGIRLRLVFCRTCFLPFPRQVLDSVCELLAHSPNLVMLPDFLSFLDRWFLLLLLIVLSDSYKHFQSKNVTLMNLKYLAGSVMNVWAKCKRYTPQSQ